MLSHRVPFAAGAAAAMPDAVAWMVLSGYLLLEPGGGDLAAALGTQPSHRALVGCTVPDGMTDRWLGAAAMLHPDLLVLNRDEALALVPGARDMDEVAEVLGERLGTGTVVTDPSGATARLNGLGGSVRVPAGAPAIDTTGAGDAFAAALLAACSATTGRRPRRRSGPRSPPPAMRPRPLPTPSAPRHGWTAKSRATVRS